jgi:hypothetical protein
MTIEELGSMIVQQIQNAIDATDRENAQIDARIKELEAQGYRIINGGQISSGDEPDKGEYTDWRTGEVLWTGAYDDSRPDNNWYHIDHIQNEVWDNSDEVAQVAGLSDRLIREIQDLASNHEDEFRELVRGDS